CSSHPTSTPPISTLSLHDALPISLLSGKSSLTLLSVTLLFERFDARGEGVDPGRHRGDLRREGAGFFGADDQLRLVGDITAEARSEEHTSELQSRENLVCRLLLEK